MPWLLLGSIPAGLTAEAQGRIPLVPGTAYEDRLGDGGSRHFHAELAAGTWLVAARQRGIDVTLVLTRPGGTRLGPFDSPAGRRGTDSGVLVLATPGPVEIEVRTRPGALPGRYTLELSALDDPRQAAAEQAASAAGQLLTAGTAAARRQAREHYRRAARLWREAGATAGEARALTAEATLARRLSEPREAVRLYREALEHWRALGDREAEATVLNRLGLALNDLGESREALKLFAASVALWHKLGERRAEALARNNLCLAHQRQGRLASARACYSETRELFRELGDPERESLVLSNLAGVHWKLGEPERALELYELTLERVRAGAGAFALSSEARALSNRALLYQQLGENEAALADFGRALELFRRNEDRRREGRMLYVLGATYLDLGELERARALLEEALTVRYETSDRRGVADTWRALGRVRRGLGESAAAYDAWAAALALDVELDDRRGEAETLELVGHAHTEDGALGRALPELERAVRLQHEIGDRLREAVVRLRLAAAHRRGGRPEQALVQVDEATRIFGAVRHPAGEVKALEERARAERDLGRPRRALAALDTARGLLGELRTRAGGASQRAAFLAARRGTYELSVDLLMELHRREPGAGHDRRAFEVSESGRSRVLLDLVNEAGAGLFHDLDVALRERLRAAERRLTARAERRFEILTREDDKSAAAGAERDFYHALAELEKVRAEARRQSPRYAALAEPRTLDAAAARKLLDDGTLLLEYALGEERGFGWALTANAFASFELPGRGRLDELARRAHSDLSILDVRTGTTPQEALSALGELLLAPVAELLDRSQRVVVVADGALHYLPFAALPRANGEPLLVSHEVVHLASASALALQRQLRTRPASRPRATRTLAVLADPVFDSDDPRLGSGAVPEPMAGSADAPVPVTRAVKSMGLEGLGRLLATRLEAEAIAALVEPEQRHLALGFDADRARVMAGELATYRYVHFATHGLVSSRHPELSGLVLSRLDAGGRPRPAFLTLHDVYGLELAAELVVLSGCQTALGKEIRGEGLVGLTRGFLWAGVPRVVASLWQVRDKATAELMARFYRAMLEDGLPPAAALRSAQLSVRAERGWAAPFFWAAFVFEGDWHDV